MFKEIDINLSTENDKKKKINSLPLSFIDNIFFNIFTN